MRLDKFLVDCGLGSRTDVKKFLKQKKISVNGSFQTLAKSQINPDRDVVTYQGQVLHHETFLYYMLHKPAGVISATEDSEHRTVLDLLDDKAKQKAVSPVGRLDKDTEGLLLLTNNGKLAHALLSPKRHVVKCYEAHVLGVMTVDDQLAFEQGIVLSDHHCLPAQLEIKAVDQEKQTSLVTIKIKEGKFHQIKRMVKACGKEVTYLKRLSMGPLELDPELPVGHWRLLTDKEQALLADVGVTV